jgi:hypothetical protein
MLMTINQYLLNFMAFSLHRMGVAKSLTQNGFFVVRIQKQQSFFIGTLPFLWLTIVFLYYGDMVS